MIHFDLADLRLFVAVAQSPSLTQGARQACLSPAAASTRLRKLEDQLKCRLFFRNSKGMTLSPQGHQLLSYARSMLRYADEISAHFSGIDPASWGHVRIFANSTAIKTFLPRILGSFLSNRPDISIDLQEQPSADIIRAVRDQQIDFGIISGSINVQDLHYIHFKTDHLYLVIPQNHPFTNRQQISLREALQQPFVGYPSDNTLQQYIDEERNQLGYAQETRIRVNSFESAFQLIAAGVGVGIAPLSLVKQAQPEGVVSVRLSDASAVRQRAILVKDMNTLTPASQALIQTIQSEMKRDDH